RGRTCGRRARRGKAPPGRRPPPASGRADGRSSPPRLLGCSAAMRVLIFHGYMLRGTGSNIYNANLACALARLGHEVHLLCQDRKVKIEGVEIHNPDIGGLLPVYVKDPYEGFEVKTFPELTEVELAHYIEANVAAVRG